MNKIYLTGLLLLVAACSNTTDVPVVSAKTSPAVKDRIALCNAGISASLSVSVEAKIAENIRDGAKVDAGIENELKGLLLNSDKVTPENVENVYNGYLKCLNGQS